MSSVPAVTSGFDSLAHRYTELWSDTAVGIHQRRAVWRWIDRLFNPGEYILDLGCGTGDDAIHLQSRNIRVHAIDASAEMVRIARARGVDAQQLAIQNIDSLACRFDGVLSNFGALNCLERLDRCAESLAGVLRPGGYAALCILSKCCAWETCHFLRDGNMRKAFRRLASGPIRTSLGVDVTYPSASQFRSAFRGQFTLLRWYGIGLCVPPSYIRSVSEDNIRHLAGIDLRIAHWPLLRAAADHRLFIFKRL